jgi:hypothetical protein
MTISIHFKELFPTSREGIPEAASENLGYAFRHKLRVGRQRNVYESRQCLARKVRTALSYASGFSLGTV